MDAKAKAKQTKFIFVMGGVLSGVGKGITASSIGKILKGRGLKVNLQKCDPYINTDAGTLNPAEHGEVFVTADGAETDLDLGHYERFLDQELNAKSSLMSGAILSKIIAEERAGKFLGKTVQIIPHITNAIQDAIADAGRGFDVHIVEIGGTVGDYEGLAFLEAIREFKYRAGAENTLYVNVVYLPYLEASAEVKTKPAQNAVRALRASGITPDVLIARTPIPVGDNIIRKLSLYCDVPAAAIVPVETVDTVYRVPLMLEESGIGQYIAKKLNINNKVVKLGDWQKLVDTAVNPKLPKLKIGLITKYIDHQDTYMSVTEAINAAVWHNSYQPDIHWFNAEKLGTPASLEQLEQMDGLIVPGGFGERGIEGKIKAADFAMTHNLPYLGLCYGMQVAVIALARKVLGPDCHTTEVAPEIRHPVISLMAEQNNIKDMGGTMRLGNYPCQLAKGSLARKYYRKDKVLERHRHRFEFNNAYRDILERAGMWFSGVSPDGKLVEIAEIRKHPFFIGTQFHPEFKSRVTSPHPLFDGFAKAAIKQRAKTTLKDTPTHARQTN